MSAASSTPRDPAAQPAAQAAAQSAAQTAPREPAAQTPATAVSAPTPASTTIEVAGPSAEPAHPRRSVPASLTLLRLGVSIIVLAWAALTTGQLILSWQATRAATGDVQQLIRTQQIKVDLLRADALATNAFLVGGLEPSTQRAAYDNAVSSAMTTITAAARAQPADGAVLSELSTLVVNYASSMELARANNRQGLPVGAAYLSAASSQLRGRGMALVDAAITANTNRSSDSLADQHPIWIALPGLGVLVVLWWTNRWIARRFRRRINVGLALCAGLVLAVSAAAVTVSAGQVGENDNLRSGSFLDARAGSAARSSANLARSNESLRLIARGSGAAYEKAWGEASTQVTAALRQLRSPAALTAQWEGYAAAHRALVALDDAGDWDGAVAAATATGPDTATAKFTAFDDDLGALVTDTGRRTTEALTTGSWVFLLLAVAALLFGAMASALAWRGVSRRLEEYS